MIVRYIITRYIISFRHCGQM